jgi:hypothetical protein
MKLDDIVNGISKDIILNEMALAELQHKDVLSKLKQNDYKGAVDLYLEKGGKIGGSASPKRTITAVRGKVIAQDPRFKDISLEMLDGFEEELVKRHEEAKKGTPKPIEKKEIEGSDAPQELEPISAKEKDTDLKSYFKTLPEKITSTKKYTELLTKSFENGFVIPKEYRNDVYWIKASLNLFAGKEGERLEKFIEAKSTREARQKVKAKAIKSSLEKQNSESEYDRYGYPKELKKKNEKEVSELIKKSSSILFADYDSPEEKERKEKQLIDIAEKILAARKSFIFKTDDNVLAKMPEEGDELYPLAKAVYDYKKGEGKADFKKLILGIKRIGTHSTETIKEKQKTRIDNEINVAFSEIDAISAQTSLDVVKALGAEVLKLIGFTAKEKPARKDFLDTPKYFDAINFLWMINFGPLKDAKDIEVEKVKSHLRFIKKEGIKTLLDIRAMIEGRPADVMMAKEKSEREYGAKLKESRSYKMGIQESILKEGIQYNGKNFEENYFFSRLSRGFVADYKLFGEETVSFYTEIFGEEYTPIFESMEENIETLTEAVKNEYPVLFEEQPAYGLNPSWSGKEVTSLMGSVGKPAKAGLLSGIWSTIKNLGSSLAAKFPKLGGFLQKGIGWITANPLAVVGVAGGALLLGKIIKALKKKGANEQAAKLQAVVDKEGKK